MSALPRLRDAQVARVTVDSPATRAQARPTRRDAAPSKGTATAAPLERRRRGPSAATLFAVAVVAVLGLGLALPTAAYLTPQSGVGYALGITGGSMMLLLLVYPLRKRVPGLRAIGSTRFWFRTHMVLGVLGPVLILFHSNFHLGATNSNVALVSMLIVAGSGLFGRYFYGRIHLELHGHRATLGELKEYSARMRHATTAVSFLPDLAQRIDMAEVRFEQRCARAPLLVRPVIGIAWGWSARRRLERGIVDELRVTPGLSPRERETLRLNAARYVADRLGATRRVVEFHAFERAFSLWHALHMPLFVMLIIAGTVHVFAVHVY